MPLMKCGHASNGTTKVDGVDIPCCCICVGIVEGWDVINPTEPDLTGRLSQCCYCGKTTPSALSLAFFEHRPRAEKDSHYCGCKGWD